MITKKLQKADIDTNALIDTMQAYLKEYFRQLGIRGIVVSREMAWDFFQTSHKLPYMLLISRNPTIIYQGQGRHLSKKHSDQQLVIKNIGRFEMKGVSHKKDLAKTASIKFKPSKDIEKLLDTVEVLENEDL